MTKSTMDSKVNIKMFFNAMGSRLQGLLASALTPEEKLTQIIKELEKQVQEKRILAREIGGQMRAIADPETATLEPLEAMQARRIKLVKLGGTLVDQPDKAGQLGQLSQEIKSLDAQINAQFATFGTLKESYDLAKASYKEAMSALDTVRQNGGAMLKAIEAHKQAIAMREKASSGSKDQIDTSFLNELQSELSGVQAELRSDKDIDNDLDATNVFNVDAALANMDVASVDEGLLNEFKAAK